MTTWVIISWVFVAILTAVNIWVFLKLKNASDQMMKMAFPQAKNMKDALGQMQGLMGGMGAKGGMPGGMGRPGGSPQISQQQMKMAMDMLANMGKQPGKGAKR